MKAWNSKWNSLNKKFPVLFQKTGVAIKDEKEIGVVGRASDTGFRNLALNGKYRISHIEGFELDFKAAKI